jgi:hypothetical protein
MACQPLNTVLNDGTQVFCMQWPATTALENLNVALSVMGPRFASFVEGTAKFTDVIGFTMTADHQQYVPLLKRFTNGARVNGQEAGGPLFDTIFSGDLSKVFEVFGIVAKHNYHDFFAQGLLQQKPAEETAPQSQDESPASVTE